MANNMVVKYESAFGEVTLTSEDVKKYLVRGGAQLTDQELKLGMELCKYQRLNPFTGEVYFIKFRDEFQLVVGYETYKRRAEENPEYKGRKSGIVVLRGDSVVQKEGTCIYPGEQLIGGWCRVERERNGKTDETFKEVSLSEYNKGQANWKTKPATMIEKVAVSQALRSAFPKDYENLYTSAEFGSDEAVPTDVIPASKPITQEQRRAIFDLAQNALGKDEGNAVIKEQLTEWGLRSSTEIMDDSYDRFIAELSDRIVARSDVPDIDFDPTTGEVLDDEYEIAEG